MWLGRGEKSVTRGPHSRNVGMTRIPIQMKASIFPSYASPPSIRNQSQTTRHEWTITTPLLYLDVVFIPLLNASTVLLCYEFELGHVVRSEPWLPCWLRGGGAFKHGVLTYGPIETQEVHFLKMYTSVLCSQRSRRMGHNIRYTCTIECCVSKTKLHKT